MALPAAAVLYSAEAVLVALTVWGQKRDATPLFALDIAVGGITLLLLPALQRRPVATGYVLAALAALSIGATTVASLAVWQVAIQRRLAVAVRLGAFAAAMHLVRYLWRPWTGISFAGWAVEVCAVAVALICWGAYLRSRAALLNSLRERARRAEAEQGRRVAEARAAERGRIAREMHDVLAHRLTLLATYAGALEFRPELSSEQISEAGGVIRSNVREALSELRQIIYVLRDDADEAADADAGETRQDTDSLGRPQPGLQDVPELVEQSRSVGAEVHLDLRVADPGACPQVLGRTAYRVIQEALTNARRHAPGVPVLVIVAGQVGQLLTIDVHNALVASSGGPSAANGADLGSGTGLIGLTERVRLAGGSTAFGPEEGEFHLHVVLPWTP
jgi:signal transduction histidine kinase